MFKALRIVIVAFSLMIGSDLFACLNSYNPVHPPLQNGLLNPSLLLNAKSDKPYWSNGWEENELIHWQKYQAKDMGKFDFKEQSDYAVLTLKFGQKEEALALLEKLYRSHPTEYNIVANLGTAYELNGNKIKALEFLRKAVAINPRSHYDSEWIHIRILEEELAVSPDLKKITNLGIGNFQQWITDKSYKFPRPADSLKLQLAVQLHERIGFIAPQNKTVAQLVTDFADIVAKTDSLGAAKEFYLYALTYDSTLRDTIAARIGGVEASQKEVKDTFRWASIVWALPLLALLMVFLAWLKNMRRSRKSA